MRKIPGILAIILCLTVFFILTGCDQFRVPLTEEEAVAATQALIAKPENLGITNFDTPEIEKLTFAEPHLVLSVAENGRDENGDSKQVDLNGKTVYKVTYHTDEDESSGPIALYVDYRSGAVYGMDARR
ncbi:MAG: hypothetical protein VB111_11515 [Clostridiaceae bacterium]|nr:hypothetical protein [Clostridiaceae bacterium]